MAGAQRQHRVCRRRSDAAGEYGACATETPQPRVDKADELYMFRLYSIGAQVILWATLGLCFAPYGTLATRTGHP